MFAHCPYLEASTTRGTTVWTVYEIAPGAPKDAIEAELFHAAVGAAERVRLLMRRSRSALVCENIVVLTDDVDTDCAEVMAWPHWALKHLYGPVGVMFGKFVQGVEERDTFGRIVPPAPYSFLPVRASIRPRDPGLLKGTPALSAALAMADDNGRDVFEHIPCEWKAVRAWASSLPAPARR
ncbi:hypothetical protein [Streptomyces sp. NPDC055036]